MNTIDHNNIPKEIDTITTLEDLLNQSSIGEVVSGYLETNDSAKLTYKDFIDYIAQEIEGMTNPFVKFSDISGQSILIHRYPILLDSVEEVTGKKKKKITHYHTIGFIGLSSEGLFSIVFPAIKGDPTDLERLGSSESTFTVRGGDVDFNYFEEVIKKYNHENRGIEGERYIKFLGFSDTQKGKVPVITLKRNEKLSIDPELLNFSLQENPYYPYIVSQNTSEGVQAFKEALDAFIKKIQELKNVHGNLLELFESHFPNKIKNRES